MKRGIVHAEALAIAIAEITLSQTAGDRSHLDDRRNVGFFAGVERIVDDLLQDDERPILHAVAGRERARSWALLWWVAEPLGISDGG